MDGNSLFLNSGIQQSLTPYTFCKFLILRKLTQFFIEHSTKDKRKPLQGDDSIANIRSLLDDESLRFQYAQKAYQRAKNYSWNKTAEKTGIFIDEVLRSL